MKIYTGYYAKIKKYTEAGLVPVSIAGRAPAFYNGIQFKKLAPTFEIFNAWKTGEINDFEYTSKFRKEVLGNLDKLYIKEALAAFGEEIILLCYEKSGDFCHRHIVADWIEEALGVPVEEFQI